MNKNSNWLVFGVTIALLAVLIAFGPIFVTKYMRAKWQNGPQYKTSNMLVQVKGTVRVSSDNQYYLEGDNGLFYVFENLKEDFSSKVGQKCDTLAKMRVPKNNEVVDGNPVRLFIEPSKIAFGDEKLDLAAVKEETNKKVEEKAKFRVEVNAKLGKPIMFDVIQGKVSKVIRKNKVNRDVEVYVLVDKYGDSYMLYKKGKNLAALENRDIVCLGRQIMPLKKMPLVVDEVTFEIYEVYDLELNKIQ